jgi:NAD(P)-dependent dehydrogenase (short-subunit alcohol dehydrogenase family)
MTALAGEVAIVTGAGQGLGAAIADALEREGALVARTDIEGADVELDVRDRRSVEQAVVAVATTLGEPSVLINNAGLNRIGPSEELEEALFQEVVDVNLTGTLRCCQVAGKRMLARGRGSIVNVASINAEVGMPGRAAYCASKAGLVGLTRVLAVEWAPRGVRVNAVEPGYVRTPMIENAIAQGLLAEQDLRDRTPLDRLAEPGEVARAVVFLASKDAAYVTGQTLVVDGGYLAYGAPAPASAIPITTYSP